MKRCSSLVRTILSRSKRGGWHLKSQLHSTTRTSKTTPRLTAHPNHVADSRDSAESAENGPEVSSGLNSNAAVNDEQGACRKTLFVGDIGREVSMEQFCNVVSKAGRVTSVRFKKDRLTQLSLGYAFVCFETHEEAKIAKDTLHETKVGSRRIRIGWAQTDAELPKEGWANRNSTLVVSGLSRTTSEERCRQEFENFGPVESFDFVPRLGLGTVKYRYRSHALAARQQLQGAVIGGQKRPNQNSNSSSSDTNDNRGGLKLAFVVPRISKHTVHVKFRQHHNLDPDCGPVDEELFWKEFSRFGQVVQVELHRHSDNRDRGYAFVHFQDSLEGEAAAACTVESMANGRIGLGRGVPVRCGFKIKKKDRSHGTGARAAAAGPRLGQRPIQERNAFAAYEGDEAHAHARAHRDRASVKHEQEHDHEQKHCLKQVEIGPQADHRRALQAEQQQHRQQQQKEVAGLVRQEQLPTEEEERQAERNALWCIVKSKIEDFEKNRPQDVAEAKQMRNLLLLLLRSNLNHNLNPSSPKSSLDLEKRKSNSTDDFDWETKAIRSSILKVHKSFLAVCAQAADPASATDGFALMTADAYATPDSYTLVIEAHERAADVRGAELWFKKRGKAGFKVRNSKAMSAVARALLRGEDRQRAAAWLGRMEADGIKPDRETFNLLISRADSAAGAQGWFSRMQKAGHQPDSSSYSQLALAYLEKSFPANLKAAEATVAAMREAGYAPATTVSSAMVGALVNARRLRDAEALVDQMRETTDARPSPPVYDRLIRAMARKKMEESQPEIETETENQATIQRTCDALRTKTMLENAQRDHPSEPFAWACVWAAYALRVEQTLSTGERLRHMEDIVKVTIDGRSAAELGSKNVGGLAVEMVRACEAVGDAEACVMWLERLRSMLVHVKHQDKDDDMQRQARIDHLPERSKPISISTSLPVAAYKSALRACGLARDMEKGKAVIRYIWSDVCANSEPQAAAEQTSTETNDSSSRSLSLSLDQALARWARFCSASASAATRTTEKTTGEVPTSLSLSDITPESFTKINDEYTKINDEYKQHTQKPEKRRLSHSHSHSHSHSRRSQNRTVRPAIALRRLAKYAKNGDVQQAEDLLENAQVSPNDSTYRQLVRACMKAGPGQGPGQAERAAHWLRKMENGDSRAFSDVIRAFAEEGDLDGAEQWLKVMEQQGLRLREGTFTPLIQSCGALGQIDRLKRYRKSMARCQVVVTDKTRQALIFSYSAAGHNWEAERHFSKLKKAPVPQPIYNAMVQAHINAREPRGAAVWILRMRIAGYKPSGELFLAAVRAHAEQLHCRSVQNSLDFMLNDGEIPLALSYPEVYAELLGAAERRLASFNRTETETGGENGPAVASSPAAAAVVYVQGQGQNQSPLEIDVSEILRVAFGIEAAARWTRRIEGALGLGQAALAVDESEADDAAAVTASMLQHEHLQRVQQAEFQQKRNHSQVALGFEASDKGRIGQSDKDEEAEDAEPEYAVVYMAEEMSTL